MIHEKYKKLVKSIETRAMRIILATASNEFAAEVLVPGALRVSRKGPTISVCPTIRGSSHLKQQSPVFLLSGGV